jgi:hypothetical protein
VQRPAHLSDRSVQAAVEIDKRVGGPKRPPQFLPRHDLARMFEQHRQDLKRLLVKLDSAAVPVQLTGTQIGFEDSEPKASGACGGHAIAGWGGVYHDPQAARNVRLRVMSSHNGFSF